MIHDDAPRDHTMVPRPRVLLLGSGDPRVQNALMRIRPMLEQQATIVAEDYQHALDLASVDVDFVVVLGGDGTILRSARQLGLTQRPIIGVNLGKLGFLADLSPDDFLELFPSICRGEFHLVHHLMLDCQILREGRVVSQRLGLNEVAVLGGPPYSLLEIDLYVDAEWVTTYSCDGLIISTPVGSTAHSLSAGGPILRKDVEAFVISPISPHTLTVRPVVDAASRTYEMIVHRPHESTAVVIDGDVVHRLLPSDRVRVSRAVPSFQLVEVSGRGYYRTLREKLGWGGRIRRPPSD